MKYDIASLTEKLLTIMGDDCPTKTRYIENAHGFLATLTNDQAVIQKGLRRLFGPEMIADIRNEGAAAWQMWQEIGLLDGLRNRDLAALKA